MSIWSGGKGKLWWTLSAHSINICTWIRGRLYHSHGPNALEFFDMLSTCQQHTFTHSFISQSIPKLLLGIAFITAMEHKVEHWAMRNLIFSHRLYFLRTNDYRAMSSSMVSMALVGILTSHTGPKETQECKNLVYISQYSNYFLYRTSKKSSIIFTIVAND